MIPILYAIVLILLPILVFPFGSYSFETSKVFVAELAIWIILLYTFIRSKPTYTTNLYWNLLPQLVLLSCMVFHMFLNPNADYIWGNPMRLQGVFLYITLVLFSISSKHIRFTFDPRFATGILGIVFISSFVIQSTESTRAVGLLGESNALAAAVIGLWPFCVRYSEKLRKIDVFLLLFALLLSTGTVIQSGSRSGLIALLIQVIFYIGSRYKKTYLKGILFFSVGVYILMHLFVFLDGMSSVEQRSDIWHVAISAVMAHPLIGSGVGSIETSLHQASWVISNPVRFLFVDSAHNVFLDFWIQLGGIGVICLLILIYRSLRNFYVHAKWMQCIQLIGLIFVLSFNPLSVVSLVLFWFLIGQGTE